MRTLVQDPDIRFAALIDPMGNLLVGGPKKGLKMLESEEQRRKMYMEIVLRVTSRKDFDEPLGAVKYASSRREKLVVLTFPLGNNVLLVSAEPRVNIEEIANKVLSLF